MRKTESVVDHYSRSNVKLHDKLMKEFMVTTKQRITVTSREGNETDMTVDTLCKLASSIGFIQQCQTVLQKNLYIEKHIKEINTKLDRIPPEVLQSMMSPKVLEPIET